MAGWKRDFASGLVIVVPILVSFWVILWLYNRIANVTPERLVDPGLFTDYHIVSETITADVVRVGLTLVAFVVLVFAVGYLMRTTYGGFFEDLLDDLANSVPGLRVVYNASKMAAETAFGGSDQLQAPVKIETWPGMRMTAFKTGKSTHDGKELLFLPTAPNITTGFVLEVDSGAYEEYDETVEDALTRILSAGFGDADSVGGQAEVSLSRVMGFDDGGGEVPDVVDADVQVDDDGAVEPAEERVDADAATGADPSDGEGAGESEAPQEGETSAEDGEGDPETSG